MFIHVLWLEPRVVFVSHSEFLILNPFFPSSSLFTFRGIWIFTLASNRNFSSFKQLPGVKQRVALLALQQSNVPSFVSVPSQDSLLTDPQRLLIL